MAGHTVGYGPEASLPVTSGMPMTYPVPVVDLSSDDFAANQYSNGVFTDVQEFGGKEF